MLMSFLPPDGRTSRSAALRVAALSPDPATLRDLAELLKAEDGPVDIRAKQGGPADLGPVADQEHPDILVFEGRGEAAIAALEKVTMRHKDVAVVLVSAEDSPVFLLAAMRAGVREVLKPPLSREEFQRCMARIRQRAGRAGTADRAGRTIAFLPCKGGSGATFLAANLAHALALEGKRVTLIDLNLHFGDAALYVSEQAPPATVVDVARQVQRLDSAFLEASMLRVTGNFSVLAAPEEPEAALDVAPESIGRVLAVARSCADYVVLDLDRTLDAVSVKALDQADDIYLVLQLTLPFIRDAGRLLKLFRSLGYPASKLHVLVNRFEKSGNLGLADLERVLGVKEPRTIPNSFGAVAASINQGRPIIDMAPRDPVSRALQELARQLAPGAQPGSRWLRGLFGGDGR